MQKQLTLRAYAKVNLVLDVLRRRPDGYHDVRMVMQNLDLCDVLTFTADDESQRIVMIFRQMHTIWFIKRLLQCLNDFRLRVRFMFSLISIYL